MTKRSKKDASAASSQNRQEKPELTIPDLVREQRRAELPPLDLTQTSNGQLLVAMFGAQIRYCFRAKKWFVWDATRWGEDAAGVMARAAKHVVQELRVSASRQGDDKLKKKILNWAHRCQSAAQQEAMLKQAASEPGIPVQPDEFDRDPWLLGLPNGTLELRSRVFRPSRPADLITRVCGVQYDPAAQCPNWEAFLKQVFPSPQVRWYLQKLLGICLTGDTTDQNFYVLWGEGANGKTTAVQTIASVLGDYAIDTPTATLLSRARDGGVPNDLARLRGARFVYAAEPDISKKLAEELLKRMTGGDPITARFLFAEFFTFFPEFKLFLLANHRPHIDGQDHGTWRRIKLVPFTQTIPTGGRINDFRERHLLPESSGILNWMLDGLAGREGEGLYEPVEIRDATENYRRECDDLAEFLEECVVSDPDGTVSKRDLYQKYRHWNDGGVMLLMASFSRRMKERGLIDGSTGEARVWKGIRLRR